MRIRLLLLAALAAPAARPQSVAGEVNKDLPPWLRFGGEYRARVEAFDGIGFRDASDTHFLNRVRLNLKVQPAPWFKLFFQGQDARIWGNDPARVPSAPPYKNAMDLRQGYLELGDPDAKTFGLRAGRQELVFGEQRLIGHTSWSNTARTFDAVRATVNYHDIRLDAFAATVVNIRDGEFDRPVAGNNFHGLYGSAGKLVPRSVVEAYALWRVAPNLNFYTFGTRWAGKLPAGFDYGLEMAAQTGTYAHLDMRAWAGHWQFGYTLPAAPALKPRLIAEYNYATGDQGDGRRRTFDSLYPTPHGKYGLTDQVGWRNIHDLRYGIELKPRPVWTLLANYHNWWRASARDGLYNAAGTLTVQPRNIASRHIGQEVDFDALWTVTTHTQVGAGIGHLFPGAFLKQATPGHSFTYPYLLLNYIF